MKQTLIAGLIGLALTTPAFAADSYSIDPRHTFPVFEVNHLGFSTQRGRFNQVSGKITLDTAKQKGSVDVSIATDSIDMGLDDWDKHMKSEDFFHVAKYPTMTFKSDKFVFNNGKPVAAEGSLTLLGVTRPVRLTIAGFTCGIHPIMRKELCAADVSTSIKRSEFGMTKYLPAVGDEIRILIPVEAFKD